MRRRSGPQRVSLRLPRSPPWSPVLCERVPHSARALLAHVCCFYHFVMCASGVVSACAARRRAREWGGPKSAGLLQTRGRWGRFPHALKHIWVANQRPALPAAQHGGRRGVPLHCRLPPPLQQVPPLAALPQRPLPAAKHSRALTYTYGAAHVKWRAPKEVERTGGGGGRLSQGMGANRGAGPQLAAAVPFWQEHHRVTLVGEREEAAPAAQPLQPPLEHIHRRLCCRWPICRRKMRKERRRLGALQALHPGDVLRRFASFWQLFAAAVNRPGGQQARLEAGTQT